MYFGRRKKLPEVSEEDRQRLIDEFIEENGVTKCEPAVAYDVDSFVPYKTYTESS